MTRSPGREPFEPEDAEYQRATADDDPYPHCSVLVCRLDEETARLDIACHNF